jgi:hypothetical protein|nr:MAG TPA: hypothetical protein [Caudoviricetes sp.]
MAKEHDGRFGKLYSAWAYDENEDAMRDANARVYHDLRAAVSINPRNTDDAKGKDELVYENSATGYAHRSFMVKAKPEWMTMAEAALVIDMGSLCFGFQTMGNVVTIFTD